VTHGHEKSDSAIVTKKPPNKAGRPAAEAVEPRAGIKGNTGQHSTRRAQIRESVSQALERVRQAARQRKKEKFTALLHHISVETLEAAFYALKRKAAPGVDGVTWQEYEADLERRLIDLHGRITAGLTGPSRPAGPIFRRRTDGSGPWRLPPWKTKSFRALLLWC
jgi:RNA-directed DNA polymerase